SSSGGGLVKEVITPARTSAAARSRASAASSNRWVASEGRRHRQGSHGWVHSSSRNRGGHVVLSGPFSVAEPRGQVRGLAPVRLAAERSTHGRPAPVWPPSRSPTRRR